MVSFMTSRTKAAQINILSAIGSNNSPSFDSAFKILASSPSRKSVKLAPTNRKKGIKSPYIPGKKKVITNIGTTIIRPIVKIFGIFKCIKFYS